MTHLIEPVSAEPPTWAHRTVLRQQWCELASFHWPYEPSAVQRLLPAGVTVDTFDGMAWVGLIPFEMRDVRIGPTPPVPWLGSFLEINVRTYVTDAGGRRAVWFFSLDVPRSAIVAVARTVFSLPYCLARTGHEQDAHRHRYTMTRRWPRRAACRADMRFTVADPVGPDDVTDLEHFVSARWALLTTRFGSVLRGPVDHARWPLHRLDDVTVEQDVIEAAGLPTPVGAPLSLYSPGVDVRVGPLRRVRSSGAGT